MLIVQLWRINRTCIGILSWFIFPCGELNLNLNADNVWIGNLSVVDASLEDCACVCLHAGTRLKLELGCRQVLGPGGFAPTLT